MKPQSQERHSLPSKRIAIAGLGEIGRTIAREIEWPKVNRFERVLIRDVERDAEEAGVNSAVAFEIDLDDATTHLGNLDRLDRTLQQAARRLLRA